MTASLLDQPGGITMDESIKERARAVKLLILDVDGVLTDGQLYFTADGEAHKVFNVRDGHGIRLLLHYGFKVAAVSGRSSPATACRLADLGVEKAYLGFRDKQAAVAELIAEYGVAMRQVACMGDDLPDLAVMTQVGFACAAADAHPEVVQHAHWVASAGGGRGAVRELSEVLLKEQGHWGKVLEYCLS